MVSMVKTGRAAAASGVLMFLGVEGEWVLDPQADDGTVTNQPVLALLMLSATAGFTLLLLAVHGLRTASPRTRPARVGALLSLCGAGLLVIFGATALVTTLLTGKPWEAAFLAFLLGMLLLAAGPVTWGLSMRRHSSPPGVWQLLLLSGLAAFGALALEADPWHDVSLVVMYAAWSAVGLQLLREGRHSTSPADRRSPTRASAPPAQLS